MKIKRYLLTIYDCDVHEDKEGDWVKHEDVKPLLKRIKELERQLEFERSLGDWM